MKMKSYLWASSLTFAMLALFVAHFFTKQLATLGSLTLLADFTFLASHGFYLAINFKKEP